MPGISDQVYVNTCALLVGLLPTLSWLSNCPVWEHGHYDRYDIWLDGK
jgi:hypothetical protein